MAITAIVTIYAICFILDVWQDPEYASVDRQMLTDMILGDLQKAFDTSDQGILL